jgi:HAE1 family hydrophobic/amphiphilic exporter-1
MRLSDVCIRRPVFSTMLIVSLVVLGLASYRGLGLDLFPKVDLPTITITTRLPGASPEEVETQITKPVEEVVNTINGLDELRSTTSEGTSQVLAVFRLEKDPEVAANDVRDKVGTILAKFPEGTDPPIIQKFDPDAAPILALVVSGRRSDREITEIADRALKRPLETVSGVGSISFVGDRKREIQVRVNPDRLSAYGVSIAQVKSALIRQNLEIPGGRVTWDKTEKVLRTMGRVERAEEFLDIVAAVVRGTPVTIRELGTVQDDVEEPRTLSRLNGQNAVSLLVRKQSGTNTVQVADAVRTKLAEIARTLPPDIQVTSVRDQSRFIRRSLEEVQIHLVLGGLLASGVVLLFIRNLRAAVIAAISIPTSIIATFSLMRAWGFSLNNMTMLGLSLSTGIIIDDAIIVLENIFRYIEEEGYSPLEAAKAATREIGLAVMATTLSLVVIFLPVAFMSGVVGRFFFSFGITTATAILVSMLVAFTLTPMMSARFLRGPEAKRPGHASKETRFFRAISGAYDGLLRFCLRHRLLVMSLATIVVLSTGLLFSRVGKELIVDDDQGEFEIVIQAPEGSSLAFTDGILRGLEAEVARLRGVTTVFTTIGSGEQGQVTDGSLYVGLSPLREGNEFQMLLQHLGLRQLFGLPALKERGFTQEDVKRDARRLLAAYPDLKPSVQNVNIVGGGGWRQTPFNLSLRGPDLGLLERYSQRLMEAGQRIPGMVDVDTTLSRRKPEIRVLIDRKKAADLGVSVESLASSLTVMVGGEKVTKFKDGDEQYEVRLRLEESYRKDAAVISTLGVPSEKTRGLVRLQNLVRLEEAKGPAQIERYNRERQVSIVANLEKRLPLGDAIRSMAPQIAALSLPPGYSTIYVGRGKTMAESVESFFVALVLSVIFIYMVLAAQFESLVHPLAIMVSLPLSAPFGLLSLLAMGSTLNVYSAIGFFMLMGVVKKNAILQVDYTNTLRERGLPREEAIRQADHARLRPILMTTLAIIAGMLPIALGKGDGSASRASMATVVVGGQALCLLLTLLVTPVVYSLLDDLRALRLADVLPTPGRARAWLARRVARALHPRDRAL